MTEIVTDYNLQLQCFYLQVILLLINASLGLENCNTQALRRGQFWKNSDVWLSHIWRRPSWELLDILTRYCSQLFLSKIWDKMFSTIQKSRFCCSWGDVSRQKESTGLQKLTAGAAWGSCQFLTTEPIFAVEVITLKMLQVGLTPRAAYSHTYLLLCFSWALQAQQDALSHCNYVYSANTLCRLISKYFISISPKA